MTNWLQKAECLPGCASRIRCLHCKEPHWALAHREGRAQYQHEYQPALCDCGRVQAAQEWADLQSRLERAEAMARRYEWLRLHSYVIDGQIGFGPGCDQSAPEYLDSKIDDAMGYSAALEEYSRRKAALAAKEE